MKWTKKDISPPAHDFNDLRSNIATFCSLLFTLFGEGCGLYRSMFEILKNLNNPLCMQNKQAYSPEVCHRIMWAIIVDTRLFFDDIKLAEDFLEQGNSMMFPSSMLEGEYLSIKHGNIIHRHNFPQDWETPALQVPPGGYYPRKGGGGGYQPLQPLLGGPPSWQQTPVKPPPNGPYKW